MCSFPDGTQAVVNVNSTIDGASSTLTTALLDAYALARE